MRVFKYFIFLLGLDYFFKLVVSPSLKDRNSVFYVTGLLKVLLWALFCFICQDFSSLSGFAFIVAGAFYCVRFCVNVHDLTQRR